MKRILVAMDLSPSSDRAFERAVRLTESHEASLTLLHVIDEQTLAYGGQGDDFEAILSSRAEQKLARHWAGMPEALVGRFSHTIKFGSPWESIVGAASDETADLIVLGLHRVNPLKDMFVGTTAERVIRNSPVPVLVVKDKPTGPYRSAIAATDFSPCSSHALQAGLRLAPDADFTLLHVFETPFPAFVHLSEGELREYRQKRIDKAVEQTERDLEAFLQTNLGRTKPRISVLCERGEVVGSIASTVKKQQADLLVLGTHGRTGISRAMLGSVAVIFLTDPPCDVLVSQ